MQSLKDSSLRIVGSKEVLRAIESDLLDRVFVALDADENLLHTIKSACDKKQIVVETVPTMEDLGKACCIEVKAATAGIKSKQ